MKTAAYLSHMQMQFVSSSARIKKGIHLCILIPITNLFMLGEAFTRVHCLFKVLEYSTCTLVKPAN